MALICQNLETMPVEDIFQPDSISGEDETNEYADQVHAKIDSYELTPAHGLTYVYGQICRDAVDATRNRARGVACAITVDTPENPWEIIARGRNNLADENDPWKHVAHGEIITMTEMNRVNIARRLGGLEEHDPLKSDLWSSLGPCQMCMSACVNQRIKRVHTISPDWTAPITMETIANMSFGYGKYITQYEMTSDDAPVEMMPFDQEAQDIRLLCWSASRIKEFEFNKEEHRKGYQYLTKEALLFSPHSVDDLMK